MAKMNKGSKTRTAAKIAGGAGALLLAASPYGRRAGRLAAGYGKLGAQKLAGKFPGAAGKLGKAASKVKNAAKRYMGQ